MVSILLGVFWIVWATGAYIVMTSAVLAYSVGCIRPTKSDVAKIILIFFLSWVGLYYDHKIFEMDFKWLE